MKQCSSRVVMAMYNHSPRLVSLLERLTLQVEYNGFPMEGSPIDALSVRRGLHKALNDICSDYTPPYLLYGVILSHPKWSGDTDDWGPPVSAGPSKIYPLCWLSHTAYCQAGEKSTVILCCLNQCDKNMQFQADFHVTHSQIIMLVYCKINTGEWISDEWLIYSRWKNGWHMIIYCLLGCWMRLVLKFYCNC